MKQYLPEEHSAGYDRKLRTACSMNSHDDAHRVLRAMVSDLERLNTGSARGLEEGREETLSVLRLELALEFRRSFSTTNLIESAFSYSREVMRNVKRWRSPEQAHR